MQWKNHMRVLLSFVLLNWKITDLKKVGELATSDVLNHK